MIIQKLLLLESEAQDAMRSIEKEQVLLAKQAKEDLILRIGELEREKDIAIKRLEQNTEEETTRVIAKIQAEYEQKRSELITAFAANHHTWRDKVTQNVLY